jgi:hypothetical protein
MARSGSPDGLARAPVNVVLGHFWTLTKIFLDVVTFCNYTLVYEIRVGRSETPNQSFQARH